jgi:hypothetical protein
MSSKFFGNRLQKNSPEKKRGKAKNIQQEQ